MMASNHNVLLNLCSKYIFLRAYLPGTCHYIILLSAINLHGNLNINAVT